jgi:hypothetical protein
MSPQNKPTMAAPPSGVTVRMYNSGFGDTLLLAFRANDNSARYMLIDCGVHHLYPDRDKRIKKVARDISKATANHLHVVAITHEHTDHLYGFKYARDIFKKIRIDQLWLAWTENPRDKIARDLKKQYGMNVRALTAAVQRLKLAHAPLADPLRGLLEFESPNALSATGGNAAQLQYLRTKSRKKLRKSKDYRRPGEPPLTLPGVQNVKFYVLGPPRSKEWIKKLIKKDELYPELAAGMNETTAFAAAALAADGGGSRSIEDKEIFQRSCPFFEESIGIPDAKAQTHPEFGKFFQKHYGFAGQRKDGSEWRRIETDWLVNAEQLALSINNKTNNTSLVLAVELTKTKPYKVLLFAADAQVGNWLSWHEVSWPGEGQDGAKVDADYLLDRTVLYKVGHHGSHNATLKEKGLEMMDSDDLVAMIPVDEKWAVEKRHWEHPAKKLLARLKQKTDKRVIRMDKIPSGNTPPKKPSGVKKSEWNAFLKQLDWDRSADKLWIQFTVPG